MPTSFAGTADRRWYTYHDYGQKLGLMMNELVIQLNADHTGAELSSIIAKQLSTGDCIMMRLYEIGGDNPGPMGIKRV